MVPLTATSAMSMGPYCRSSAGERPLHQLQHNDQLISEINTIRPSAMKRHEEALGQQLLQAGKETNDQCR
jgi:hypothetical protein